MSARFALAVLLTWLMPWRAVRTIREQRSDFDILVRTLGHLADRRAEEDAGQVPPRHLHLVPAPGDGLVPAGRHARGMPRRQPAG